MIQVAGVVLDPNKVSAVYIKVVKEQLDYRVTFVVEGVEIVSLEQFSLQYAKEEVEAIRKLIECKINRR